MNKCKKSLFALMAIMAITATQYTMLAETPSENSKVVISTRFLDQGQFSYGLYEGGLNEVIRAKQFISGTIIEGSVDWIGSDHALVTVKKLKRKGIPYGGSAGFSKNYLVTDQFQLTLKLREPQKVYLSDHQCLEIKLEDVS